MAAVALAGFLDKNSMPPNGVVVTAVLPGGCPFACPFCIVTARDERFETSWLRPEHHAALLRAIACRGTLGAAGIVGDEPLQESAWPYAEAFLDAASALAVPTALVTNGSELGSFVPRLLAYPNLRVLVSVDGIGASHDRIRRTAGAFARIQEGLRIAVQHPSLRTNLTIAVTLTPRNVDHLGEILHFVKAMGIPRMVISPVLSVARGKPVRLQPRVLAMAARKISLLVRDPESRGVSLHFTDEFGLLGDWEAALRAAGIDLVVPRRPPDLIRVDANGRVESLRTVRDGKTTGLCLPHDLADMDQFVDALLSTEFSAMPMAA